MLFASSVRNFKLPKSFRVTNKLLCNVVADVYIQQRWLVPQRDVVARSHSATMLGFEGLGFNFELRVQIRALMLVMAVG